MERNNICCSLAETKNIDQFASVHNIRLVGISNKLSEIKDLIEKNKCNILFFERIFLRDAYELFWLYDCLDFMFCIDSSDVLREEEKPNRLMSKKIWNFAAINAKDDIECGGWISSYTREKFDIREINEFVENTKSHLESYLDRSKSILEIGCASGFTMYALYSFVKTYVGVDLCNISIEKNRKKIQEMSIKNIQVECMEAIEIDGLHDNFDIILLNSVVHCFKGYNYLFNVFDKIIKKINSKGIIYFGDIMNLVLKDELCESLIKFASQNDYNTKIDFSNELFLSKKFFAYLEKKYLEIEKIEYYERNCNIQNELTQFRFDVVIHINKKLCNAKKAAPNYIGSLVDAEELLCQG